jgi:hypothetical protein
MACVTPTSTQAPVALPVPRSVSGTSSSRGHEDVDELLAKLAVASAPLRIRIPQPSKEERKIVAAMARLGLIVELEEELLAARDKHLALCFNSSASEWAVGDAQLYVAELELELAKVKGDNKEKIRGLEKRVVRLRKQQMALDEETIKRTQQVLSLEVQSKTSLFGWLAARV